MRLHVIFAFKDTPQGKKICYQVLLRTNSIAYTLVARHDCDVSMGIVQ